MSASLIEVGDNIGRARSMVLCVLMATEGLSREQGNALGTVANEALSILEVAHAALREVIEEERAQ